MKKIIEFIKAILCLPFEIYVGLVYQKEFAELSRWRTWSQEYKKWLMHHYPEIDLVLDQLQFECMGMGKPDRRRSEYLFGIDNLREYLMMKYPPRDKGFDWEEFFSDCNSEQDRLAKLQKVLDENGHEDKEIKRFMGDIISNVEKLRANNAQESEEPSTGNDRLHDS